MPLFVIAAMAKHRVIGYRNQLPWHLPADLRYFRAITLHKTVIMGRHTFLSIGKALPHRINKVLTTDPHFSAPGIETYASFEACLASCDLASDIMVIGGASLYHHVLAHYPVQRLYLTLIDHAFQGDTYFPAYEHLPWVVERDEYQPPNATNRYAHRFVVLAATLA